MNTSKSRFQVRQDIPTFVGGEAAANHFFKARRKPGMDIASQDLQKQNPELLTRGLHHARDLGKGRSLGFLIDQKTRQVIDRSAQLDNLGCGNLPNHLVGARVGHNNRRGLAVGIESDVQISVHGGSELLNLGSSGLNHLPGDLSRLVNRRNGARLLGGCLGGSNHLAVK